MKVQVSWRWCSGVVNEVDWCVGDVVISCFILVSLNLFYRGSGSLGFVGGIRVCVL